VHPTGAQLQALDAVLAEGRSDVIVQAETGSGKTLAYLLPALARIDPTRSSLQAVVVVPTRELGLQVSRVARRLAAGYRPLPSEDGGQQQPQRRTRILVMTVLQGSQNRRQRAWAWAEPPHVAIGTPGELLEMVRRGGFRRYGSVRTLVVDEVDACLLNNVGRIGDASSSSSTLLQSSTLHELLSKFLSPTYGDASSGDGATAAATSPPENLRRRSAAASSAGGGAQSASRRRTTIFCSATIPQPRHFLRQCVQNRWMLGDPSHVRVEPSAPPRGTPAPRPGSMVPSALEHGYFVCSGRQPGRKLGTLRRILARLRGSSAPGGPPKKVLVFCDPSRPMAEMARILSRDLSAGTGPNGISLTGSDSKDGEYEGGGLEDSATFGQAGSPVVSVLSLDDGLSQRALALSSFRGESGAAVAARGGFPGSSSSLQQAQSTTASSGSSGGGMRVMLSTDLAARGLDIVDITHIIHYDIPSNADTVRFFSSLCA
jgi:superfamily II DNA/RNA helicase